MQGMLRAVLVAAGLALIPATDAMAASYASRTLSVGSKGSDVRALQRYLDRAGFDTTADGAFGPATARSVRGFETAEQRRVDGRATAYEQRLVRAKAKASSNPSDGGASIDQFEDTPTQTETPPSTAGDAYVDDNGLAVASSSAPPEVQAIIAAGNKIASKPYKYGGGHGRWRDSGYDCSGSVSYALHGAGLLSAPLDSSAFMSWGGRGRGEWVTIYTNPSHAYMVVAGLRFDTSARKASGSRWTETMRSSRGYRVRHPEGL
jgi:peptidoglycan hydrolase-like protein with peptidoglycan-binding domain